jgi:hypothetical protein
MQRRSAISYSMNRGSAETSADQCLVTVNSSNNSKGASECSSLFAVAEKCLQHRCREDTACCHQQCEHLLRPTVDTTREDDIALAGLHLVHKALQLLCGYGDWLAAGTVRPGAYALRFNPCSACSEPANIAPDVCPKPN